MPKPIVPKNQGSSPHEPPAMQKWLTFILIFLMFYYFFTFFTEQEPNKITYSEFKLQLEQDNIKEVTFHGSKLTGVYRQAVDMGGRQPRYDGSTFKTYLPPVEDQALLSLLETQQVNIVVTPQEQPFWVSLIIAAVPWILIFAFIIYSSRMIRQQYGGKEGIFGFGTSRAKRFRKTDESIGFDEVAGLEAVKTDLLEIVDYLKAPQKFQKLGAKMPKGILLMGPPGTGKTLLARATAGEANVPFYSISGSEFIELFVGVGASRVRDLFQQARKSAPALIFIDEIDSVGRVRGTGLGGGNDEREQTLNQILAEMDGFSPEEVVVVLAATNRPDVLDPALLRPGRFDRKLVLELPQRQARIDILKVHTRKVPLASDVDLEEVAAGVVGFSGADIKNLVNEAALQASRENKSEVSSEDFDKARDKIILGSERADLLNPDEKKRIAYHESGHALVAYHMPEADPLHKVTIIPRGRALGMTEQLPTEDRHNFTQTYLESRICVLLGGRCAEKLTFESMSSGAADDLNQATKLAKRMVMQWGMNEKLGAVSYRQDEEHPFLGNEMTLPKEFSEKTAELIDEEVRHLIQTCENRVLDCLKKHQRQLARLAEGLMDHEMLSSQEIREIFREVEATS